MTRKTKIWIAERLPVLIFVLEALYSDIMLFPNSTILIQAIPQQFLYGSIYSMWMFVILIFFMGHRLIYQNNSDGCVQVTLRRHGFFWFYLLYSLHLLFSFLMNIWFFFFVNHRWAGLILFMLKLAVVLYLGIVLHKIPVAFSTSGFGQEQIVKKAFLGNILDVLCVVGILALFLIDICIIAPASPLHKLIGILGFGVLAFLLLRPD